MKTEQSLRSRYAKFAVINTWIEYLNRLLGALLGILILVQEAFNTGGFGKWPANADITLKGGWMRSSSGKPFYVKPKKSTAPLIDTGQLRRAVSSEVAKS